MDDLIRKQTVLNMLDTEQFENQLYTQSERELLARIWFAVNAIPSAQQWIPCSERLPDQNGKYLVVGRQKAINILKFDGGRWYGKWGVVAWMPLPSPYREEVSD